MKKDNLLKIERGFWHEGADYYNKHISDEAVFIFPGMRLEKEDGVTSADQAPRWNELEITNEELIAVSDQAAVLTYHATAKREGEEPYAGSITTVYRIEAGEPKMIFHQHTPDPEE